MRKPGVSTILLTGSILLAGVLVLSGASESSDPPPSHQPIDFFHQVHAGERQIACEFCHRTAKTADFAGMPSTRLCMSCHRVIILDSPEIWKLRSYWELGSGVPWQRVYSLPAHVFFSHKAHTALGKMTCEPCHGPVQSVSKVGKARPMTMGWCLDCHRKQKASTDCWACHR